MSKHSLSSTPEGKAEKKSRVVEEIPDDDAPQAPAAAPAPSPAQAKRDLLTAFYAFQQKEFNSAQEEDPLFDDESFYSSRCKMSVSAIVSSRAPDFDELYPWTHTIPCPSVLFSKLKVRKEDAFYPVAAFLTSDTLWCSVFCRRMIKAS